MVSIDKDVQKLEPRVLLGRDVKWYSTVENSSAVSEMVKHRVNI